MKTFILISLFLIAFNSAGAQIRGYQDAEKSKRFERIDTVAILPDGSIETEEVVRIRRVYKPIPNFTYNIRPDFGLSVTSFNNWVEGGSNSVSGSGSFDGLLEYQKDQFTWRLSFDMDLGYAKVQGQDYRKTVDMIDLNTLFKWDMQHLFNPVINLSLRTQFANAFDYSVPEQPQISAFFDPAYLIQSIGLQYKYSDSLTATASIALREIYTQRFNNFADNPNTPEIEKIDFKPGFEFRNVWLVEVFPNVTYRSRIQLFTAFVKLSQWDVNWKQTIRLKINENMQAQYGLALLYQQNASDRVQIQQALELNFGFKFSNN